MLKFIERICRKPQKNFLTIQEGGLDGLRTINESYWEGHNVGKGVLMRSAKDSIAHIKRIDELYPFYFDYFDLYSPHENEVILDYGCGPGNDLAGYYLYSKAKKIIGVDVSLTSLGLAAKRLQFHGATNERISLIKISDKEVAIPLENDSIDYFQSSGVIHHTTDPLKALKELYRVLKPGKVGRIMVYNYHSLYVRLTVPYEYQLLNGQYPGMSALEAFQKHADCGAPIARCDTPDQFKKVAESAGFEVKYKGAAFSITELNDYKKYKEAALCHPDFPQAHKDFLTALESDERGYPKYQGYNAGIDAIFECYK